jgi:hypothetical protein
MRDDVLELVEAHAAQQFARGNSRATDAASGCRAVSLSSSEVRLFSFPSRGRVSDEPPSRENETALLRGG